jgi:endonuclease YncB( thermonuclease family)
MSGARLAIGVAIACTSLALTGAAAAGPERQPARGKATKAVVDYVVDGDTIRVLIGRHDEYIRFIGIDTPEVYGTKECGGPKASRSMKRMLKPGDRVRLVRDRSQGNRDTFDRLLRYVDFNGRDLGRRQIKQGWAQVYVYDRAFDRLSSYNRAEAKARARDRGVWGRCGGF